MSARSEPPSHDRPPVTRPTAGQVAFDGFYDYTGPFREPSPAMSPGGTPGVEDGSFCSMLAGVETARSVLIPFTINFYAL